MADFMADKTDEKDVYAAVLAALRNDVPEHLIDRAIHCAFSDHLDTAHEKWVDEGGNGRYR